MAIRVRTGGAADVAGLLTLYDEATQWLVDHGRGGQWGTQPFSRRPELVRRLEEVAERGELRVAEDTDARQLAGALWLTQAPGYAPAPAEPEIYLEGFVVGRRYGGRGVGQVLLDAARAEAAGRGAVQLRLDCWAGGDQALVRYYERAGFTATGRLTAPVGSWEGVLLTCRLLADASLGAGLEGLIQNLETGLRLGEGLAGDPGEQATEALALHDPRPASRLGQGEAVLAADEAGQTRGPPESGIRLGGGDRGLDRHEAPVGRMLAPEPDPLPFGNGSFCLDEQRVPLVVAAQVGQDLPHRC
jgi:GNAT superfamily N-acetyltransferase